MSDPIVARVQRAILTGVDAQEVHDALAALGIEGGREPVPGVIEEVRYCTFHDVPRERMRNAFSNVGVNPIDPAEALQELILRLRERNP